MPGSPLSGLGKIDVGDDGRMRVSQKLPGGTDPIEVGEATEKAKLLLADPIKDQVKLSNDQLEASATHSQILKKIQTEIKDIRGNSLKGSSIFDKMEAKVVDVGTGDVAKLVGVVITSAPPSQIIDFAKELLIANDGESAGDVEEIATANGIHVGAHERELRIQRSHESDRATGVRSAEADILPRGGGEDHGLLRDERDAAPEIRLRQFGDGDAVDFDAAGVHVIEALQKLEDRRLAGA